jgi:pimeloyl-ACP methyl ester carboxylesterase
VHVREWGSPEGRPLVFWHALGALTSGAYLTEVAPVLTQAGLWLIAPDAPGFGESPALPPEGYRTEAVVGLVEGLLDERGVERAVLMGHSWGGTVMTAFAAADPQRVEGLVLVDSGHADYQDQPSFPHGKTFEELVEEYARPERGVRTTEAEFERDVEAEVRRTPTPELVAAFRAGLRKEGDALVGIPTPEVRASAMAGLMDTRVSASWPAIAEAGTPILLAVATEPAEARAENEAAAAAFAERFPDAEIRVFEGAGHDLFADAGPELGRAVAEWAGRLPPR